MMNKRLPISKELRDFVLQRDEYTCRYCGSTYGPFHLDHVYPVSKGGETTANNLVTACRHCNLSKHSKVGTWPNPIIRYRKFSWGAVFENFIFWFPPVGLISFGFWCVVFVSSFSMTIKLIFVVLYFLALFIYFTYIRNLFTK